MIQQTLRKLFRAAPDREAIARAQHQRTLQDAQQIVQRAHAFILETLAGIEVEALEQGRVRCAPQNRAALRALIAERPPLLDGTPLSWRLQGRFAHAVGEVRGRWPQATAHLRAVLPESGLPDSGTAVLIEFCAARRTPRKRHPGCVARRPGARRASSPRPRAAKSCAWPPGATTSTSCSIRSRSATPRCTAR